jgi:hypothetical protein
MLQRPFLTARWTDLLLLNFEVSADLIASVAPPGTEPDLHEGKAYISIVGFRFQSVRLKGLPIPGHTRFDEINLRYYVTYTTGGEVRRGVVFVREIVPRRAVALVANRLYNENYVARPMRSAVTMKGPALGSGDRVEYCWSNGKQRVGAKSKWNRLGGRITDSLQTPARGSLEEFIVEHYWGYVRGRDGSTHEYRVMHPPWRVAPADDVAWDCDLAATYGSPWAEYLAAPPANAVIADGSAIQVFRGRRI